MNFLQICQRVRQETGVSGDGPSNVSSQTGMYKKIVEWVLAAHEEIQLLHPNWKFDWAKLTVPLTAGTEAYLPSTWSISPKSWDFDSMYVYATDAGPTARTWLAFNEYSDYRRLNQSQASGRPVHVTWMPNKSIALYPIPVSGLTFCADYYMVPEVMTSNTSTPRIPSEYHMAIVWRAVMFYAASEEHPALAQTATRNFVTLLNKMEATELDGPFTAETLA